MNRWSESETELLIQNYNRLTNDKLMELFPSRSFLSIYKKAKALGFYKNSSITFQNRSMVRKGDKSPSWKGGRKITKRGYVLIMKPGHPRADRFGYVMEHIVVFEEKTGITVPKNCVIHHLDGNKQNNDISNLCMMSFGGHSTFHNKRRRKLKRGE